MKENISNFVAETQNMKKFRSQKYFLRPRTDNNLKLYGVTKIINTPNAD